MLNISLTKRYIPALLLLATFILLSHILTNNILNSNNEIANIINISGKQRMLSQKLLVLGHSYYENPSYKEELQKVINEIKLSHEFLLTKIFTKDLENIYFKENLDKNINEYIKNFENLLLLYNPIFLKIARTHSNEILIQLDKAVKEYEKYSNEKIKNITQYEFYIMLFTLFILLLEALFIFRPAAKKIEQNTKELLLTKEYEKQLIKSEKMASLGEMIGNIAHQWRQPLNLISTYASGIKLKYETEILEEKDLTLCMDEIVKNTKYLSDTIDIFRNFIKGEKTYKQLPLQDEINNAITIVSSTLKNNYIKLDSNINSIENIYIYMIAGELQQAIINILNNAKDAIIDNKIADSYIFLNLEKQNNHALITIEDNAGGISNEIITNIFEPYFSTKITSNGTGLGLYMSYKIIVESLNGEVYVKNTQLGAKFYIKLPLLLNNK